MHFVNHEIGIRFEELKKGAEVGSFSLIECSMVKKTNMM